MKSVSVTIKLVYSFWNGRFISTTSSLHLMHNVHIESCEKEGPASGSSVRWRRDNFTFSVRPQFHRPSPKCCLVYLIWWMRTKWGFLTGEHERFCTFNVVSSLKPGPFPGGSGGGGDGQKDGYKKHTLPIEMSDQSTDLWLLTKQKNKRDIQTGVRDTHAQNARQIHDDRCCCGCRPCGCPLYCAPRQGSCRFDHWICLYILHTLSVSSFASH